MRRLQGTPIRLIASDLDGTFLRTDRSISPRTMAAVQLAHEAGIDVVVATGRQIPQVPKLIRESGVDHAIGSNGGIGFDLAGDRVLFEDLLAPETMTAIIDYFVARIPDLMFSAVRDQGTRHVAEPGYAELVRQQEEIKDWGRIQAVSRVEVAAEPTLKFTARHPEITPDELLAILDRSGITGYHATTSGAPFLEIAGDGVTKASGLAHLCRMLGIESASVVTVGDARNDVEMLRWAGVGVAMGNSVPEAIEVADWVTASNDEDGLALAIEAVLENQKGNS